MTDDDQRPDDTGGPAGTGRPARRPGPRREGRPSGPRRSGGGADGRRSEGRRTGGAPDGRGRAGKPAGKGAGARRTGGGAGRPRDDAAPAKPVKRSLHGGAPPPRRGAGGGGAPVERVPKPSLPRERPTLPGGVLRDIRRTARATEVNDIAAAVAVAGEALEAGDLDRAIELLTWARSRATRSTAIREGLGVALYLAGRWEDAQRELQAYRRLTGRADQNHLLADVARALGRTDRVPELVDEVLEAHAKRQIPVERVVEALIVQAAIRREAGDHLGALAVLERAPVPDELGEAHARLWYAAGDIAEAMGDQELAREYFSAVGTVEEDFLDVDERLAALGG